MLKIYGKMYKILLSVIVNTSFLLNDKLGEKKNYFKYLVLKISYKTCCISNLKVFFSKYSRHLLHNLLPNNNIITYFYNIYKISHKSFIIYIDMQKKVFTKQMFLNT